MWVVPQWKVEKENDIANNEQHSEQLLIAPEPTQQQEPDATPIIYNAMQIALNFLAQGLDVQLVAQSTGLPIAAVQALADQIDR